MAVKKTIQIEVDSKKAVDGIDEVTESIQKTEKAQKKTNESVNEGTKAVDKFTGGAVSGFTTMFGSLRKLVGGFRTLKGAIAATGIGALVVVIGSLSAALTTSEEGQNKLNKAIGVANAVIGNVVDKFADFGDFLIRLFSGEGQAMQSVKSFFNTIRESFTSFGSGLGKLFKLDFAGAVDDFKKSFEPLNNTIKEGIEGTKNFIKEQQNEAQAAAKVADMRAKADKLERSLLVERSKREQKIAELRLKSRQEDQFSADVRKQALLDAQALEDELLAQEVEALQLRADAQTLENTFARSNKQNLDEEARLRAEVNRQIAARTNQQRQTQRELNRLNKEIVADEKRIIKERADFEKSAQESLAVSKEEQRELELKKEAEKYEELILKAIEYYGEDSELALQLTQAKEEKLLALKQKYADEDAKIAEELAKKREEEAKRLADKEKEIEDRKLQQQQTIASTRILIAKNTIGAVANLAEEGSDIAKAAAVAQTLINTYESAVGAYKSVVGIPVVGPALAVGAAASATAFGLSGVKRILATNTDSDNPNSGSSVSIPSGGGAPQVPTVNFNTLQGGFNQLEGAINNQNQQPVQAYVTTQQINNANQLNRKVVGQSNFG